MNLKTIAIALALLGPGAILPASADNSSGKHGSTSPMMEFAGSGRVPGPDDFSTLRRRLDWVDLQIETSGLDPVTPYTAWAVIFNRPQYCSSSPCGLADLPFSPGHDPRVLASVAYVTGGFSSSDGTLALEGRFDRAHNGVKPTETLFGPGLINGRRAELHFVLRGHGQDFGDPLLAIGSYSGGCSESNACSDQQATVHLP
jgi:hypothetical protein